LLKSSRVLVVTLLETWFYVRKQRSRKFKQVTYGYTSSRFPPFFICSETSPIYLTQFPFFLLSLVHSCFITGNKTIMFVYIM
jgi:hypothetical protein